MPDAPQTLDLRLSEVRDLVDRAIEGEFVPVPDGFLEELDRLRGDITLAVGPRELGDLSAHLRAVATELRLLREEADALRRATFRSRLAHALRGRR